MTGFRNFRALSDAFEAGQVHTAHFRKLPTQASVAGQWVDLSMAGGNPLPNYYASAPLEAAVLDGFRGIFHGAAKAPMKMNVFQMALCTPSAGLVGTYQLLDYLMYYPFVDLDSLDQQDMVNITTLPRYTDGRGVRAMLVAVAPTVGGGRFTYTYINQDGIQQTSPTMFFNTTVDAIGTIVTSQQGLANAPGVLLPLVQGDTGIRSIVSVNVLVPNGGLASLVLVKPICFGAVREINVPEERSFVNELPGLPVVEDGAYLNLVVNCAATVAAGQLAGRITFVWN